MVLEACSVASHIANSVKIFNEPKELPVEPSQRS